MALFRRKESGGGAAAPGRAEPAPGPARWRDEADAPALLRAELAAMTAPETYARDLPVRLLLDGCPGADRADELVLPAALWERVGDLARAYWLSVASLVADRGPAGQSPAWDLVIFSRADRSAADMAVEARFLADMVADPLLARYLRGLAALLGRWAAGPAERLVVATVGLDTTEQTIDAFRAHFLR